MTRRESEIWLVNLDPTIGTEINKTQPCLVIGDDVMGRLKSRTVLPITGWNAMYDQVPWMVRCDPTPENGLSKSSAIDAFQIRNLSTKRFIKRISVIEDEMLFEVHSIVAKTLSVRYRLVRD